MEDSTPLFNSRIKNVAAAAYVPEEAVTPDNPMLKETYDRLRLPPVRFNNKKNRLDHSNLRSAAANNDAPSSAAQPMIAAAVGPRRETLRRWPRLFANASGRNSTRADARSYHCVESPRE